ncbi:MAG: hypothetical protein Q9191_005929 [Dirinaria sp. TL-2023a]
MAIAQAIFGSVLHLGCLHPTGTAKISNAAVLRIVPLPIPDSVSELPAESLSRMRKTSAAEGRRSLLPQKSSNSNDQQSIRPTTVGFRRTSALTTRNGNARLQAGQYELGSADSHLSQDIRQSIVENNLQEVDESLLATRELVGRTQEEAKVKRQTSTSRRLGEDNSTVVARRIMPPDRPSGQKSTTSRIATPQRAKSQPTVVASRNEVSISPVPSITSAAGVSGKNNPSQSVQGTSKLTVETARKVSATGPNTALSHRARSSSQQLLSKPPPDIKRPPRADMTGKPKISNDERPTFSTYQQHFTPRKGTKAPSASFLVKPSQKDAADDDISPEFMSLQMELAQLHLLHRSSNAIQMEWEQIAQASFKRKTQQLSEQQAIVQDLERKKEAFINYPALRDWSQSTPSVEFAERIRILSKNLHDICILLNSGGKYHRVVDVFESWFAAASNIRHTRGYSIEEAKTEYAFLEDLGDGWKAEVASLERKLTTASRELQGLGNPTEGSSIAIIMSMLRSVTGSMLEELDSMRGVERDLMMLENSWIEQEVAKITKDFESELKTPEPSTRSGIWHG